VQYTFAGLNPESEYQVAAEYSAPDGVTRLQDMSVDGIQVHDNATVTSSPYNTGFKSLPHEAFKDGKVTISINRRAEGTAVVSQLWLKETGVGFSPQQLNDTLPTAYSLEQNYPNPFNPSTVIRYAIPQDGLVTLKVYDITGREVTTLVNEQKSAGTYEARFDARENGKSLASGVYFYRVQAGAFSEVRKMVLLK
jgi:hypothetical protein